MIIPSSNLLLLNLSLSCVGIILIIFSISFLGVNNNSPTLNIIEFVLQAKKKVLGNGQKILKLIAILHLLTLNYLLMLLV